MVVQALIEQIFHTEVVRPDGDETVQRYARQCPTGRVDQADELPFIGRASLASRKSSSQAHSSVRTA
ncbi:hypothetical protein [Oryza sativa Japonica Group]|uniref:Uncharacterized protein n=1 Tax=Oryza sativa subsp. japonica TaxID=39947 RepID=Q5QLX8_ORYSJ|nr:hypothetical protein [Oryza sativa Japonica Group]